jgi:acetyl-CoA C-acetyltransferase
MEIAVVSTGHTKFGNASADVGDLMLSACQQALDSVGADIGMVDVIYISNFSSSFCGQCHLPAVLSSKLGANKEITRIESACAAGGLALKEAVLAILSGLYKTALVVGVEKMSDTPIEDTTSILARAAEKTEMKHGTTFPGLYALMAQRHFHDYNTTEEHLAKIAVKNHKNALYNPVAQFKNEITVEDVLNSRVIASPLKLLDCSPISDGAAAVLLCNKEVTSRFTDLPIYIVGIGHDSQRIGLFEREQITTMPAVVQAAQKAFKMCSLSPSDIDVAEIHDCFTIAEIIEMEDLGFCAKGSGKEMIDEERTEINSDITINASGGLKAKGHPIGATGISQVVEIVKQLRGECGERQVDDAETGLCCNLGGSGATAVVSIFSRRYK